MKLLNCHKCGKELGEIHKGVIISNCVIYCANCNNHILTTGKKVKTDTKIDTPDFLKDLFGTFDKKY